MMPRAEHTPQHQHPDLVAKYITAKNRSNNITPHIQINDTGWINQGSNELY
jgi:hypothetical protein